MDYLYENLGDERFQEFCSILISKEFPNIQAYPVGQPDGGRDSIAYLMDSRKKEFIVFQVKFVRNANQERDIHKWLVDTVAGEVEKIKKLIPKGATSYYLLTNVRGTAHLDSGSKDKVNKILEESIPIPSICWWRDDLSTLFEKDLNLKWSFPQILNGQDILNSVLFDNLNENRDRRENVVRSYLKDQYDIDNEVKFKQIDLQNKLLELFTDVPIKAKKINVKNKSLKKTLSVLGQGYYNDEYFLHDDTRNWGAAEFILHPKVQSEIERILLEGGPGQGKSTISQYICQVHRVRLLDKIDDINLLQTNIRDTPVRLPFKIDLRDIASWVEKKNPYLGILSEEYFRNNWANSLESFLIAHIFYHSKLNDFNSSDLISICKLSPILLVFDGFDEIANINVRSQVIDFINRGISRLSVNTKSIQIIITSRPAAFTDSVGFSIDHYPHFELTDITLPIINEYVEKWIKSSRLGQRDAVDLRKLIKEKLDMPHLKDLARSPMQLAIFISLLRTKGNALPNKRTSLYDNYIQLFFDRESEKSELIRVKRDLIIDIHEYLAWVLHSEAEMLKNNGSIQIDKLNSTLKEYLLKEGHPTDIADLLFDVMKERVCALVSRVQGTFEFEVQPLREYFCAKYLYKSAPHSSAGNVQNGTKPDRLHAILRNFYWQNVVRFFAGCADAGELDMIIQELKELQNDKILQFTNYPKIITSQMLSDYVFTQKPLKLRDVVTIIIDSINLGNLTNQGFRANEPLFLPLECGGKEVVNECFTQLQKFPKNDYTNEIISVLNNNPHENLQLWTEKSNKFKGIKLTKWLDFGYRLGLIHKIEDDLLVSILDEGNETETKKRLKTIIFGNKLSFVNSKIKYKQIVFDSILNFEIITFQRNGTDNSLNSLSVFLHPQIIGFLIGQYSFDGSFLEHLNRIQDNRVNSEGNQNQLIAFPLNDHIDEKVKEFLDSVSELFDIPVLDFKRELKYWDIYVESIRKHLGKGYIAEIIAVISAGVKSNAFVSDEFEDLHDVNLSLCSRVRYARLKSGNIAYWKKQFVVKNQLQFTLLVCLAWGTSKMLMSLIPELSDSISSLSKKEFMKLDKAFSNLNHVAKFNKNQEAEIEKFILRGYALDELKYLLTYRIDEMKRDKLIFLHVHSNNGKLQKIDEIKFEYLINKFLNNTSDKNCLREIYEMYKSLSNYNEKHYFKFDQRNDTEIPYEIAVEIMSNCKDYPKLISSLAERACRLHANQNLTPIGEIALKENWF